MRSDNFFSCSRRTESDVEILPLFFIRLACPSAWTVTWKLGMSSLAHTLVESSVSLRTKAWVEACKFFFLLYERPLNSLQCDVKFKQPKKRIHKRKRRTRQPNPLKIHIDCRGKPSPNKSRNLQQIYKYTGVFSLFIAAQQIALYFQH